jgi:hypothetical protein
MATAASEYVTRINVMPIFETSLNVFSAKLRIREPIAKVRVESLTSQWGDD